MGVIAGGNVPTSTSGPAGIRIWWPCVARNWAFCGSARITASFLRPCLQTICTDAGVIHLHLAPFATISAGIPRGRSSGVPLHFDALSTADGPGADRYGAARPRAEACVVEGEGAGRRELSRAEEAGALAQPAYGVRECAVPEYRRVLGAQDSHLHDAG